ncbi:50S ribosomal protein L23 [Bacillus sp. 165]|uniref:50S ribosomal protein L23 n=1 Tax=Bacillus sp. 165 TaxID=1529117 RepID=UPI001ADC9886|nr:50S ribosomal protein L23 [Bacillus sp. 165]MBO9131095.1 50S ribosomal protein L23 [Bacillus sp. 165]
MRDPRDIIKRPVITERTMEMMAEKKYTFDVDVKSNKTEVKDAIEAIFGVEVEKVNIMNYKPKYKRVGRHTGFTNRRRKAIVKLTTDSKEIEIFEGV